MAGVSDPLTDLPPPSRFDLDDLNNFAFHPPSSPPFIAWSPWIHSLRHFHPNNKLSTKFLLLSASQAGCHLLHHLPNKRLIGSVLLPEISMAYNTLEPSVQDKACYLYALDDNVSIILASIQYSVAPERTYAWAKQVFGAIEPDNVLMLGTLQCDHFRGKLSADEPLMFRLETNQQRLEASDHEIEIPYLPSGSLVDGIAAAVLTHCQIRGLRGRLLLTWPDSDASVLSLLTSALSWILRTIPATEALDFNYTKKAPFRRKSVADSELYI